MELVSGSICAAQAQATKAEDALEGGEQMPSSVDDCSRGKHLFPLGDMILKRKRVEERTLCDLPRSHRVITSRSFGPTAESRTVLHDSGSVSSMRNTTIDRNKHGLGRGRLRDCRRKSATLGQIARAWLLAQLFRISRILGTTKLRRLEVNPGVAGASPSASELAGLTWSVDRISLQGGRSAEMILKMSVLFTEHLPTGA